jgi:hypothetical protein
MFLKLEESMRHITIWPGEECEAAQGQNRGARISCTC